MLICKQKLDNLLKVKKISYYQLSQLLGYDESYINNILKGKRPFPDSLIEKLCSVLEISKDEFVAWLVADKYSLEVIQAAINALENRENNKGLILTQNIDKILASMGMSRTALSKMINYSQSGLNRMLIGKESMSKSVITKIAPILEVAEDAIKGWIIADKYSIRTLKKTLLELEQKL